MEYHWSNIQAIEWKHWQNPLTISNDNNDKLVHKHLTWLPDIDDSDSGRKYFHVIYKWQTCHSFGYLRMSFSYLVMSVNKYFLSNTTLCRVLFSCQIQHLFTEISCIHVIYEFQNSFNKNYKYFACIAITHLLMFWFIKSRYTA